MPLDEKQREEKEAYAKKIMAEMKLKNEKFKERYREVQRDREKAEERNSSITTGRNQKREAEKNVAPKPKYEREWDRGKPNPDTVDWDSSEHHDYYSRNTRSYSDRRYRKEDSSWRSRTSNSSNNPTSSFFSKYNKNETIPESSTFRNDSNHFNSRSRSQFHSTNPIRGRATTESSYQNSKLHDHSRKFSGPQNYSESKREPVRHSMDDGMDELMWQCGSMNEVQHKLSRIENWVKSININHGFADTSETMNKKEEYKSQVKRKDIGSYRERPKKYGSVEDSSTKRSKEQTYFRAKEKSEHKFSSFSRGRGNRILTGDRCSSVSDSKNQRDGKRKCLNERTRRKCESDMSDRASSMKESDDPDWGKDKIIRARSNSKSSENSCNRENQIHISEEPTPTDSHSFGNLKSGELSKFETDEKHAEQSVLKQNFLQDNECKYGSKSFPSYRDSGNYEFESHSHQRQSFEQANNNCMKNIELCRNEVESKLASSSGNLNNEKQIFTPSECPKFDCDQNSIKSSDPDLDKKYVRELTSPSYSVPPETVRNSEPECQITDNWNERNISKKSGVDNETVSKTRDISFPDVQSTDCLELDPHSFTKNDKEVNSRKFGSECPRIITSVFDNSFLQSDVSCSDIYKKNLESAENIIIALQCNQKDSLAPRKRKVSVKRYSHKKTHNKTVKLPHKLKLPHNVKVADESLEERRNSKRCKDSHSDLEADDQDIYESDVKLVPEGKHGLTDDTKLDAGDVDVENLSDEWTTTDEDENKYMLLAD